MREKFHGKSTTIIRICFVFIKYCHYLTEMEQIWVLSTVASKFQKQSLKVVKRRHKVVKKDRSKGAIKRANYLKPKTVCGINIYP